jgi:hypothetical protein
MITPNLRFLLSQIFKGGCINCAAALLLGLFMKQWAEKFYNNESWEQCRTGFMQSKGWMCERCAKTGSVNIAKIAHHKLYLTESNINDPAVSLDWENLEALCQDCHNKEHHKRQTGRYYFDNDGNVVIRKQGGDHLGGYK